MADIAYNPKTGEAVRLEGGKWVPAPIAKNDKGEVMAFDGAQWMRVDNPPERSTGDLVGRALNLVPQGINDAVAGIAGMPGELAKAGIPVLPNDIAAAIGRKAGVDLPIGSPTAGDVRAGLDYVGTAPARVVDAIGTGSTAPLTSGGYTSRTTPETTTEKAIYGGARGAGDALAMLTGAGAVSAAVPAGSLASRVAGALMTAPGTQLAASGVGGATGEATGNPWLGLAAGVGTALVPTAAKAIGGGLRRTFVEPFTEVGARRTVGEYLPTQAGASADDLANALMAKRVETLPGVTPTTAETARNAGLAGAERMSRSQTPAAFQEFDEARRAAQMAQLDRLGQGIDPTAAGAVIRGSVADAEKIARQQTGNAYTAARAATSDLAINPQQAYTQAAAKVGEIYGTKIIDTPPEIVRALQAMRSDNVTVGQMQAIRSAMSAIAGDEAKHGRTTAGVAGAIVRAIDDQMDSAITGGQLPAEAAALWRKAAGMRAGQGMVFENQTVKPMLSKEYGQYRMDAGAIPGQFANTGNTATSDIARLVPATRADPRALEAAEQFIVGNVRNQALNRTGDQLREQQLAAALQKWEPAMRGVPGMPGKVESTVAPVLADLESARFARDAGRTVGSNTFQNFALARSLGGALEAGLVGYIPGARTVANVAAKTPFLSSVTNKATGFESRLNEALAEALRDPVVAADMIKAAQAARSRGVDVQSLLASILLERMPATAPQLQGR